MLGPGLACALAILLAALCTRLAIAAAPRLGLVAKPNPVIPQHRRPVPEVGGLGVLTGVAASATVYAAVRTLIGGNLPALGLPFGFAVGAIGFWLVGVVDDRCDFAAWLKFLLQMLAGLATVLAGVRSHLAGLPEAADLVFSAFVIVSIVNAVNLTDVCDGLVGSIAVAAFAFFALTQRGNQVLPLVCAGGVMGFLAFNRPPARVFLGDSGSSLVGFALAGLVLAPGATDGSLAHLLSNLLVLGVPVFEVVFLPAMRARGSRPWWRASSDHFSLRLQAAGLSKLETDAVALAATAMLCLGAVAFRNGTDAVRAAVALSALAAGAVVWRRLSPIDPRSGQPARSADPLRAALGRPPGT